MGLDLPSGGHLTHGFYTYSKAENKRKAVSATSVYFESLPYRVDQETGLIDYEALAQQVTSLKSPPRTRSSLTCITSILQAALFKPSLLIMGGSAYPREWDYVKFQQIAKENGCLLMMDMAHISGLVVTGEATSPFDFCDIVTTTTHKSLRGMRLDLTMCFMTVLT